MRAKAAASKRAKTQVLCHGRAEAVATSASWSARGLSKVRMAKPREKRERKKAKRKEAQKRFAWGHYGSYVQSGFRSEVRVAKRNNRGFTRLGSLGRACTRECTFWRSRHQR